MAEELAFARKASGLVRGLSMTDAFGIGLMTAQPIFSIWYMMQVGIGLFPGGNLIIGIGISVVMCGICGPLVWGMLSGSMPRSGGEYIFNSRVINPAIALGASFAQVIAVIYWNFFISTWLASPSLAILAQYMGWTSFGNWVQSKGGTFALATFCLVAGFLSVAFGMKVYKRIQKPFIVLAIGGPLVLAIALSMMSKSDFISHWNHLAVQYKSLDYTHFISAASKAAGTAMPNTWNWGDTMGCMTGVFMLFVYQYTICYVGGEVKRPNKTLLKANLLAIWVPVILGLWTVIALYRLVDFNFLAAAAHNDLKADVAGYNLPYSTSYMTIAWIASGSNWFVALMACLSFIAVTYLEVAIAILENARASFAWGLDRMGPKWFTDINPRWASPIKLYVMYTVILIAGTAVYVLWLQNALTGLAAAGMQLVSLFIVTGISAILLPFRKKVKMVWESSPYSRWNILGVPVITIAGVLYVVYILILLYYAFIDSKTRDLTSKNLITFVVAWALGLLWYAFWRWRNSRSGVDIRITYGELPPE